MASLFDPYGNRCIHACKPPYQRRPPCGKCRRRYDDAMEEMYQEYKDQQEYMAFMAYVPATETEWLRQLDLVAPLIRTEPQGHDNARDQRPVSEQVAGSC